METKHKKVCGIYLITNNLNGMSYAGQSVNCMNRWNYHKSPSSNYTPIDKAINEFGKENFSFKIEKECLPEELDFYERETIKKYNTLWPNGYNRQIGGVTGYKHDNYTRQKMSDSKKGDKNSSKRLDVRQKISNTKKNTPKPKWITPEGETIEMTANCVSHWHKDWIRLTEE